MEDIKEQPKNAAKLVTSALLGIDYRSVIVGGRRYIIDPPTIKRLCGAAYHLSGIAEAETFADLIKGQGLDESVKALSWFISGDESLAEELKGGTLAEVTEALKTAYEMVGVQDFLMLSSLAKSVAAMVAKQRR